MAEKTKEDLKADIAVLQKQLEEKKKQEAFDEPAENLWRLKQSLVNQGFTEDQAYELLLTAMRSNSQQTISLGGPVGGSHD